MHGCSSVLVGLHTALHVLKAMFAQVLWPEAFAQASAPHEWDPYTKPTVSSSKQADSSNGGSSAFSLLQTLMAAATALFAVIVLLALR